MKNKLHTKKTYNMIIDIMLIFSQKFLNVEIIFTKMHSGLIISAMVVCVYGCPSAGVMC